ncbi:hypothetical protein WN944_017167 [Citrus x changshan-huyou]|uniref:histidine kinase n=1 Tax=Citrus x changshan-huyou TaxID=2935761 RepID=A0AAP0MDA8_9ROSI
MTLSSLIAARPVLFFIILALSVLLLPASLIPYWYKMTKHIEEDVALSSNQLHSAMQSQIECIATLLHPISSSATNLARLISSSLNNGTELSFSEIETKVAPSLFQAFLTTPHASQISYIGLDGLFFGYYVDGNQTLALYSNSSFSPNPNGFPIAKGKYTWYKQPVDRDTGKLYGEAIVTKPSSVTKSTWFLKALNSTDGLGSLGTGWSKARDALFLNTAGINGTRGAVSLGFPVKPVTNLFTDINLYGGRLLIATNDGEVLVPGLPNTRMTIVNNSISFQLITNTKTRAQQMNPVKNVSCTSGNGTLSIGEIDYKVYCSQFEVAGVKSVYSLAMPRKGLVSLVHRTSKRALILLIVMTAGVLISMLTFVFKSARAARKEMHLCASLIKQMEATQQAERKSMNKSLAFANASHDIRAALAGITGLIELCYVEAGPGSELETNLRQMNVCANDLLGLLNSILDTSKVEAGKMQLIEEDFDVGELLEDVVDLFHPVAMRKGVEVVLDPSDGSVLKFSKVKGDRVKLKQILSNLLSNAVKFTAEGHISVRACVKKPSAIGNSSLSSSRHGFLQSISSLFYKNKKARGDLEAVNAAQRGENAMEFTFEVDDTGKGIPKEKRKTVFENYVQVKEGEGGTGLGLGIVQSLVRLMGGDIEIVDKENGERGTCFRFNVFLAIREASANDNNTQGDKELAAGDSAAGDTQLQHMNLTVKAPSPSLSIRTNSPRLNILSPGSRHEGSHVVLLIANEERRRIAQKFMENLGINVSAVSRWERLHSTLKRLKSKFGSIHSPHSSLGKSDLSSRSDSESASFKEVPLSAMEGTEHKLQGYKRRGAPSFILLVIDATAGPFLELFNIVAEFRRDLQCNCKVVWLDKPTSRSINFDGLEDETMDPNDDVLLKPFHGSRLYKVIKLLPEFGGVQSKSHGKASRDAGSSSYSKHPYRTGKSRSKAGRHEIQEEGSSSSEHSRRDIMPNASVLLKTGNSSGEGPSSRYKQTEIEEEDGETSQAQKPLRGKKILVADDSMMLRRVAEINLRHLGATVEACENGEAALQLVRSGLKDQRDLGAPHILPYDYILMDCEMPIMNGYEATRKIREEEKRNQVHIPIIALTAHISGEEADKTIEAGMDVHLGKPLNRDHLMEAIKYLQRKLPCSS